MERYVLTGICFVGLEGGVPNGDIELLFSLLASGRK